MRRSTLRVPNNSIELAEYEAERHKLHPSVYKTNYQPIQPRTQVVDQVSPFGINRVSSKWSTDLPRGFNQDDLRTYTIRQSDRLTAALFDRYILGNGPCVKPENKDTTTLGERIIEKLGGDLPERKSIKQRFRGIVDGSSSASVDGNDKKRLMK